MSFRTFGSLAFGHRLPHFSVNRMPSKRKLAGYRLHEARLKRAQADKAIRTHKYPFDLSADVSEALYDEVDQVASILNDSAPGSLLHFIVTALSVGGVISPKKADVEKLVAISGAGAASVGISPWAESVIRSMSGANQSFFEALPGRKRFELGKFLSTSRRPKLDPKNPQIPSGVLFEWADLWDVKPQKRDVSALPPLARGWLASLQKQLDGGAALNDDLIREVFDREFGAQAGKLELKSSEGAQTFAILPDCRPTKADIESVLREHLIPLSDSSGIPVDELMGTAQNQNGLSNFLNSGLKAFQEGREAAKEYLAPACGGLWDAAADEFHSRIDVICLAAQAVPADAGPMATSWGDYRALVGGRLQGWTSNFLNREGQLAEGLAQHREIWTKLASGLDFSRVRPSQRDDLRMTLDTLLQMVDEVSGASSADLQFYRDESARVREVLERWSREGFTTEDSPLPNSLTTGKAPKGIENWQPGNVRLQDKLVPKLLPASPKFIGEARNQMEDRLGHAGTRAIALLLEAEVFLRHLLSASGSSPNLEVWTEEEYRRRLDALLRGALRARKGSLLRDSLLRFVSTRTTARPAHLEQKELSFFISSYVRRKKTPLTLSGPVPGYLEFCSQVEQELGLELVSDQKAAATLLGFGDAAGRKDASETIEVRKIYWGLLMLRLSDEVPDFEVPELLAELPVSRFVKTPTPRALQRVFQAGYGAELRGAVTLLSRTEYQDRAVLQTSNGSQTALAYLPREARPGWSVPDGFRPRLEAAGIDPDQTPAELAVAIVGQEGKTREQLLPVLAQLPHSWGATLLEVRSKPDAYPGQLASLRRGKVIVFGKSTTSRRYDVKVESDRMVCPIRTSRYQTQFMTKFLTSATSDGQLYGMAGSSLIAERTVRVNWIDSGESVVPQRSFSGHRAYFAIPWELSRAAKPVEVTEQKSTLGVDLGEYGIGWAVIGKDGSTLEAYGFEIEPRLVALRAAVDQWQDRQTKGVFVRPETRLEKMREAAAGRIRNEIHRLAIEHDAVPVYEHEVNAFEVGSSRLRRLYATLKKTDVPDGSAADKAAAKHTWGTQRQQGQSIGAAYTSQTCRTCGRCASYAIRSEEISSYPIHDGRIIVGAGTPHEGPIGPAGLPTESSSVNSKELRSLVHREMREDGDLQQRGTQGIFRCAYLDCGVHADADMQAAHNIALKRLWYSARPKTKASKDQTSLEVFMAQSPAHRGDPGYSV